MADTRPGLQELIDIFDTASREQKTKYGDVAKLYADGERWYGKLFTERVRSIDKAVEKVRKRKMADKPKGMPAGAWKKYADETAEKALETLESQFPSGVFINGSSRDEARLAEIRSSNPMLVPLAMGEEVPAGALSISANQLGHLRDDYVLRKFAELSTNAPKDVTGYKGQDRKLAYRYALAWLVKSKESGVVADMGRLADLTALGTKLVVTNVGPKWFSYFDDLASVAHWAITDPSSFLSAQAAEVKRKAEVHRGLMTSPQDALEGRLHFGKYRDKPFADVPLTYLLWVQDLVPAAQTFMRALSGDKPDEARIPEEAKNPYFAGRRGDGLEQAVGRRVQDLDEKTRARVVRFMETAANQVFADKLKRFVETPEFREAEAKYIGFLSAQSDDWTPGRRLREGSVKDWSRGRGVKEFDAGQMRYVFHSHGDIVGASYVGLSITANQQKFQFAEPAPGLSVRAAKAAQLPSMEEAERRRTLGLKGRYRSPLAVTSELLMEAPAEFREITSQTDPEKARIAIWDQMLRWEEQIETANRPEQLLEIRKSIRVFEYMLKGIGQHFYMDELRRSWQERMNAIQGRMAYHGKTKIFPSYGGKSSKEARSELRSALGYRPGNATE